MKKKLREIVENLDHEDLMKLEKDLLSGAIHIKKLVNDQIKEIEEKEKKSCTTCGKPINPYYSSYFTIIFGPPDLKKKASFCEVDCLEYFLANFKTKNK